MKKILAVTLFTTAAFVTTGSESGSDKGSTAAKPTTETPSSPAPARATA